MTFRRKLFLFALLISGSGLAIAAAAALIHEWIEIQQETLSQVSVQADIVAANLSAALSFDNPDDAADTLASFRADSEVLAAFVCKSDESLFATYPVTADAQPSVQCGLSPGHTIANRRLTLVRTIRLKDETIGTVIVHYSLDSAYSEMYWQVVMAALILCGALVAAHFIATPIRSALLRPVTDLDRAARAISETGDYETRVVKYADDELGHLADAFNLMVSQVQGRDAALRNARDELEQRVRERTVQLADQKERLDGILRDVDAIVWEADPKTFSFSFVSDRAKDLLGYPLAQWLDDKDFWVNVLHPDDREQAVATCLQATTRGEDHTFSYRAIAADGRVVWLHDVTRVICADGAPMILRGLMIDVTEQKMIEAFKAGHKRVLELLTEGRDLSEVLTAVVNAAESQSSTMRCSVLLLDEERRLRVAASPSLPKEYNDAIDGLCPGPSVGSCGTAAHLGKRVIVEDIATDPLWSDFRELGRKFGIGSCWSEPIFASDGRIVGTLAMYYPHPRRPNPAELQLIETAAHLAALAIERTRSAAERDRLALAVEATADGIMVTDVRGVIQHANPAFSRITGYSSAELLGKRPNILKSGEQTPEFYAQMWESIRAGQTWSGMVINRRKDGSLYNAALTISPVCDKKYDITGYVGVQRDVTADIEHERDLAEALRQAQAANRSKSEFLANMSHEIRTPMTAILGFSEQLAGKNLTPVERDDAIETIHRNGEHLLAIINDILDISKMDAGKLEVHRTPCDVVAILTEVGSLLRVQAIGKRLSLEIIYDGPIPETIQTDALRLRQILLNLVGNSIKFTRIGGVTIRVRCANADQDNPFLQFSVIDTGIGIPAEVLSTLFKPFIQADSTLTRQYGGTGLGLSIAKRLAMMLGGGIDVESTPGKGSTFRASIACGSLDGVRMLTQPMEAVKADPVRRQPQSDVPTAAVQVLNCRVLYAEDGPDNQRLVAHLLRKAGATVDIVENGELAVKAAMDALTASKPFDLILMDMQMPVMDGYSATRRLRELGYHRPIVALTAHALEGDREKCLAAGCDGYASKPIVKATLLATIQKHVHSEESVVAAK
jgi:PAS domain S-box-containing protein